MITEMADFYCTLPTLSCSLDGSFYRSTGYINKISDNPCSMLAVAAKLRNPVLFRDCFIYVLGPCNSPRYLQLKDVKLRELAHAAKLSMDSKLLDILRGILQLSAKERVNYSNAKSHASNYGMIAATQVLGFTKHCLDERDKIMYPKYFRMCFDASTRSDDALTKAEILKLFSPFMMPLKLIGKT